ncbi:MAG: VanZ family protein [Fidelibacterota bacterium]
MNTRRYRTVTAGYALVILAVSAIPGQTLHGLVFGWDKAFHFMEYALLGGLLVKSLSRLDAGRVLATGFAGMIFGAVDESWQGMVSQRNASFYDWVADAAGIVMGIVLVVLFAARARSTEASREESGVKEQ